MPHLKISIIKEGMLTNVGDATAQVSVILVLQIWIYQTNNHSCNQHLADLQAYQSEQQTIRQ